MDELYTPWRLPFIKAPRRDEDACIFCALPTSQEETYILHRGEHAFVVMNLFPYTRGHLMVIPFRHLPRLDALRTPEIAEMSRLLDRCERILRRDRQIERIQVGINFGAAGGAGVRDHLHAHLVPRRPWPATAERELGEPVAATYARLRPLFQIED